MQVVLQFRGLGLRQAVEGPAELDGVGGRLQKEEGGEVSKRAPRPRLGVSSVCPACVLRFFPFPRPPIHGSRAHLAVGAARHDFRVVVNVLDNGRQAHLLAQPRRHQHGAVSLGLLDAQGGHLGGAG